MKKRYHYLPACEARRYLREDRDWYRFNRRGPKLGRAAASLVIRQQPHEQLAECRGDPLAMRELVLRWHGWETLINFVYSAHGLLNRY
jgi:hypothetical protein